MVTYTVTGTIPDTTGYERYIYKIHDTLTAGLDFVEDADGKEVVNTQQYPVSVTLDGRMDSISDYGSNRVRPMQPLT